MPFDDYSSHLKGAAVAPSVIRKMLSEGSANSSTELGRDLKSDVNIVDTGDIDCRNAVEAFQSLESMIDDITKVAAKPLTIGGDHSITFPIVKALAKYYPNLTILHFDAHPDLYDIFKGNKLSHACPFARIMEGGFASRLIQVGIRTLNQHQREQADKFNVEIHEMRNWQGPSQLKITGPVYITIDIDALDPAFAPGVSHLEPGGLSVRQIIDVLHSIDVQIVGADIVEFNPTRDLNDMTAMVAIKLMWTPPCQQQNSLLKGVNANLCTSSN
jgi:arginase